MSKEQNVVEFYVICNRLKNLIRTGWNEWNVSAERVESVAEHIYGVQMLAIAMWSEYNYSIDLKTVLFMLAVHELEETVIGDLTLFDMSASSKKELGHNAVCKILSNLANSQVIQDIIFEFDEGKTPEAIFARQCDKLECDIQCKLYDEMKAVDLDSLKDNQVLQIPSVKEMIERQGSWSGAWLKFSQQRYNYDENFMQVSNFVMDNNIAKKQ